MGFFHFIQGGSGLDVRPFLKFDYNTVRTLGVHPFSEKPVALMQNVSLTDRRGHRPCRVHVSQAAGNGETFTIKDR